MRNSEINTYLEAVELRKNMKTANGTELLVLSRLSDAVKHFRAENEKLRVENATLKKNNGIEWISVKTILPPAGERVLAIVDETAIYEAYTDKRGVWKRYGVDIGLCLGGKVTHWAYMPKFEVE